MICYEVHNIIGEFPKKPKKLLVNACLKDICSTASHTRVKILTGVAAIVAYRVADCTYESTARDDSEDQPLLVEMYMIKNVGGVDG